MSGEAKGRRLSRRALGGWLAVVAAAPAAPAAQQEPAGPPPADELTRAREAIHAQGRTLAEAAAKLEPDLEPAFRFEA